MLLGADAEKKVFAVVTTKREEEIMKACLAKLIKKKISIFQKCLKLDRIQKLTTVLKKNELD